MKESGARGREARAARGPCAGVMITGQWQNSSSSES